MTDALCILGRFETNSHLNRLHLMFRQTSAVAGRTLNKEICERIRRALTVHVTAFAEPPCQSGTTTVEDRRRENSSVSRAPNQQIQGIADFIIVRVGSDTESGLFTDFARSARSHPQQTWIDEGLLNGCSPRDRGDFSGASPGELHGQTCTAVELALLLAPTEEAL